MSFFCFYSKSAVYSSKQCGTYYFSTNAQYTYNFLNALDSFFNDLMAKVKTKGASTFCYCETFSVQYSQPEAEGIDIRMSTFCLNTVVMVIH